VKRIVLLMLIYGMTVAGLLLFQSGDARAQSPASTPNPYIDALATQAALNTQATLNAYGQQQQAAAAAAYAAQAQAQAAYAAQQATLAAGQQQAALAIAQSTADAAALQATAIVQQTRTAIELSAQQTRSAIEADATRTTAALNTQATQIALEAPRAAADSKWRDDEAVATAVVMSIDATRVAIVQRHEADLKRTELDQSAAAIRSIFGTILLIILGGLALLLIGKVFVRVWRSRALNPQPAPLPMGTSAASQSIVDAASGDVGPRLAVIEYNDDPTALDDLLRSLYGR
jgi:hypothetical protein